MSTLRCTDAFVRRKALPPALLILLIIMQSCSGEEKRPILRLALQTEPTTADPAYAVDYSSGMLVSLTHSNLVRFDGSGRIAPDLAVSWSVSADALTYVFTLGAAGFPDGTPLRAEDVVLSFRRLLDPSTVSPRWWVLEPLRGAAAFHAGGAFDETCLAAPDSATVVMTLERPAAHFLSLLSMPAAAIVNSREAARLGRDYGRAPAGSGPWRISEWKEGEAVILGRNVHSADRGGNIEGIILKIFPETMTAIAEFEVGGLDILEIPRTELEIWRTAGAGLLRQEELRTSYIGLNNRKEPFTDERVRRALNAAVDVETIIAKILFGAATRSRGSVPPVLKGGETGPDLYPYDPDKARALLAEAGYADGFEMEIWQRENPEAGRILEAVQAYLARVGVRARIVTREWSAFKQAIDQGTPDAFYLDWIADYPDAENFLMPLFHSSKTGGGGNRVSYVDAVVDSMLALASMTGDADERARLYRAVEERVYEGAPWIFLWFPVKYEAVSPDLEGYRMPVIQTGVKFTDVSFRGR